MIQKSVSEWHPVPVVIQERHKSHRIPQSLEDRIQNERVYHHYHQHPIKLDHWPSNSLTFSFKQLLLLLQNHITASDVLFIVIVILFFSIRLLL